MVAYGHYPPIMLFDTITARHDSTTGLADSDYQYGVAFIGKDNRLRTRNNPEVNPRNTSLLFFLMVDISLTLNQSITILFLLYLCRT